MTHSPSSSNLEHLASANNSIRLECFLFPELRVRGERVPDWLRTKLWLDLLGLPPLPPRRAPEAVFLTELLGDPLTTAAGSLKESSSPSGLHPLSPCPSCSLPDHFKLPFLMLEKLFRMMDTMVFSFSYCSKFSSPTPRPGDWGSLGFGTGICSLEGSSEDAGADGGLASLVTQALWKPIPGWRLLVDHFPAAATRLVADPILSVVPTLLQLPGSCAV